jgi:hypothetical protein
MLHGSRSSSSLPELRVFIKFLEQSEQSQCFIEVGRVIIRTLLAIEPIIAEQRRVRSLVAFIDAR